MRLITLIVGVLCALHTLPVASQQFDELIVFGDSHSDTGNWDEAGIWSQYLAPPYLTGRFSNGPVWVEELAVQLDVLAPTPSEGGGTNYAWGAARTGNGADFFLGINIPRIGGQVESYLSGNTPGAGQLLTIFVGHNDFGGYGQTDPTIPVANIRQDITTLAAAGGEFFLVSNLHPLGHLPEYRGTSREGSLNAITEEFNQLLAAELFALESQLDVTIYQYDFFGLVQSAVTNTAVFGFTNVTDPAFSNGVSVPNPGEYLYWDEAHFTTAFYQLMGKQAVLTIVQPDFNTDGQFDVADLNLLVGTGDLVAGVEVQSGVNGQYDLNFDRVINAGDLDLWLASAADRNGFPTPYKHGDANLDGLVDVSDFNSWNAAKFTSSPNWDDGNFNGDNSVDVSDFNLWNANKFTSSDRPRAVPEPAASLLLLAALVSVLLLRRGSSG